jgi:hypothetical protein
MSWFYISYAQVAFKWKGTSVALAAQFIIVKWSLDSGICRSLFRYLEL